MDGLLHLAQRGGDWEPSSSLLYQMINVYVYILIFTCAKRLCDRFSVSVILHVSRITAKVIS